MTTRGLLSNKGEGDLSSGLHSGRRNHIKMQRISPGSPTHQHSNPHYCTCCSVHVHSCSSPYNIVRSPSHPPALST